MSEPRRSQSSFLRRRRPWWAAALLGLLAALAAPAVAAPPKVRIVSVEPVFGDHLIAERFNVLRVMLTSDAEAVSGLVRFEFDQDASQRAVAAAPFATTPGEITPVDLVVAPPMIESARLIAGDARARLTQRPGPDELAIDVRPAHARLLVIDDVADSALWRSMDLLSTTAQSGQVSAEYLSAAASEAPRAWVAYDAVEAVVVTAAGFDVLDPAQRRALITWLHSGGEVIYLTHAAGQQWRNLLPDGPPGDLITVGDRASRPLRPRETSALRIEAAADVALGTTSRRIALTDRGERMGWKLFDISYSPLESGSDDAARAPIAAGPCGLGRLTVVGFDPRDIHPLQKAASAAFAILGGVRYSIQPDDSFNWPWYNPSSGRDQQERSGLSTAIDAVVSAPVFGIGALVAVVVGVAALGLMVSLVDGLWLRRRGLGHRSWLTALGWITIASIAAYAAPALFREGGGATGRFIWIEGIDAGDAPTVARSSQALAIFSGAPTTTLPMIERPGSWARGVSTEAYQRRANLLPPLVIRHSGEQMGGRSGSIAPVSSRQWSLRTMAQVEPAAESTLDAFTERVGDDWRITIRNAPGIDTRAPSVRIGGRWFDMVPAEGEGRDDEDVYYATSHNARSQPGDLISPFGLPRRLQMLESMADKGGYALLRLRRTSDEPDPAFEPREGVTPKRIWEIVLLIPVLGEPAPSPVVEPTLNSVVVAPVPTTRDPDGADESHEDQPHADQPAPPTPPNPPRNER